MNYDEKQHYTNRHIWRGHEDREDGTAYFFFEDSQGIRLESFKDFMYIVDLLDSLEASARAAGKLDVLRQVKAAAQGDRNA